MHAFVCRVCNIRFSNWNFFVFRPLRSVHCVTVHHFFLPFLLRYRRRRRHHRRHHHRRHRHHRHQIIVSCSNMSALQQVSVYAISLSHPFAEHVSRSIDRVAALTTYGIERSAF